jgi:hypothetical protein
MPDPMDYTDSQILIAAYVASNLVGIVFLWIAYRNTKLARFMFLLLFGWASWINYNTGRSDPEVYLDYSERAIGFYSRFITGWFSDHITLFVSVIAIGQALIAIGMLLRGWIVTLACVGVMLFLIGIAPLGVYAAFPFSITVSIAAYLVMRKDDKDFLWKGLGKGIRAGRKQESIS